MNRPIVIVLLILLFAWLFGLGYCHNAKCPTCNVAKGAIIPAAAAGSDLSISIDDENLNFAAATADNLLFASGSCEFTTPLSEDLQTVFKNTVQHLTDNSSRILALTGLYESTESNNCTDVADLGIARAEQVKQLLVEMGAPAERIEVEASDVRDLNEHKEMVVGGVDYSFRSNDDTPAVTEEVALRTDKIILYFDTNKQEINLTDEQRSYLDRLIAYLEQNPNAKASVTGHTDDRGDDKMNMRLSRKRSEFVRDFMIEQGLSKRQIYNAGIGPDEPIETNSTEEGRAKNRRVEITLQ